MMRKMTNHNRKDKLQWSKLSQIIAIQKINVKKGKKM